ncbi:hypothetical protein P8452_36169 [Trifolium repens]|nr:hypothetical protein P8452_36169 [Trifolium repens]
MVGKMSFLSVLVLFLAAISLTNIAGNHMQLIHAQEPVIPVPGKPPGTQPDEPARPPAKTKILSYFPRADQVYQNSKIKILSYVDLNIKQTKKIVKCDFEFSDLISTIG